MLYFSVGRGSMLVQGKGRNLSLFEVMVTMGVACERWSRGRPRWATHLQWAGIGLIWIAGVRCAVPDMAGAEPPYQEKTT